MGDFYVLNLPYQKIPSWLCEDENDYYWVLSGFQLWTIMNKLELADGDTRIKMVSTLIDTRRLVV
jgi:hypothetical protein